MFIDIRSVFKFECQPIQPPSARHFSVDEDGDIVVLRSPLSKGIVIGKL